MSAAMADPRWSLNPIWTGLTIIVCTTNPSIPSSAALGIIYNLSAEVSARENETDISFILGEPWRIGVDSC